MTTSSTEGGSATPLSRAMDTIRRLRAELEARGDIAPVAVVGVGLRLPGGIDTLDGYWGALADGRDLIRPIPAGRTGPFAAEWELLPRHGGFLDEVLEFDAGYFGVSPREARALDPQHRLLLEVSCEALEHAALPPDRMRDVRTGLYLGITHQDYRDWEPVTADAYWATGNGHCFAAGRVAYTLGLTGPAVAVDTACSSSLVAIHHATVALRRGECELALAGGVNLILSPRSTRLLAREMGALAPDGRCKAFDARANGFTRGEGCVMVVLKRLDAAVRDNDRILAVIKGSAVNQDGRSSGFTAPNVLAQVALIRAALADARLTPADIGLIEAHGTGTALGDPIEMDALATVLGRPKGTDDPLHVGAVKTNLGHLEAAAGAAGVVKAILSLRRGAVPPLVHFSVLNPRIDLGGTGIALPTGLLPWPAEVATRHAGVSSFGMSGTNAHVILGSPESAGVPGWGEDTAAGVTAAAVTGFELSARTPQALRELAARYAGHLAAVGPGRYPAFAYTVTAGRPRHPWRARVTADAPAVARAALAALADGADSPAVTVTEGSGGPEPVDLPRQVLDLPHYPWQRQRYGPATAGYGSTRNRDAEPAAADVGAQPAGADGPTGAAPAAGERLPLYQLTWEPMTGGESDRSTVVIAGDDNHLVRVLADEARRDGLPTVVLGTTAVAERDGLLPTDPTQWAAFWRWREPGERVCVLLAMAAGRLPEAIGAHPEAIGAHPEAIEADPEDIAERGAALCATVVAAVRALPGGSSTRRVVALTRGVRRIAEDDAVLATDHGLLHGLAPVLGLECPAWGALIDLPATVGPADARAVLRVLPDGSGEDLLAIRGGRVFTARLRPTPTDYAPRLPVDPEASYLVTGGLGGVGRALVADLVRRGARHLLLIGRRQEAALPGPAIELLTRLRADGVDVRYRAADCADPAELAGAVAACGDAPPLRGVLHAAGTLARTPLADAGPDDFAASLRGKFTGAWWLHLLLRDRPLDFFVLVSSVSALWGTDGYGAYAAANGGLDLVASLRTAAGESAVSIAFGPWAVDGMVDAEDLADLARGGVGGLSATTGCASLTARAAGVEPLLISCPVRWPRFAAVMSARRPRELYRTLLSPADDGTTTDQPAPTDAGGGNGIASGAAPLLALPELARPPAARRAVGAAVARILGYDDGQSVRDDQGFFDLGLDSMMAVDLLGELTARYGVPLQVADVFDHPTVAELAALVVARLAERPVTDHPPPPSAGGSPAGPVARATPPGPPELADSAGPVPYTGPVPIVGSTQTDGVPVPGAPRGAGEPVAIVGMAGRFPGADSVAELWQMLLDCRDGVGPVPPDRWDAAALHDSDPVSAGTITTDQGGFLRDIGRFDAKFFDIPAREAESLDPQQRLLLESAWHALEDADIDPGGLRGSRTGVFVGISNSDYARILERGGLAELDAYFGTGTALNAAAGRIAYVLGLQGPALAVDTACSSSLVAVHLAMRSLRSGETDVALVGGVNVIAAPSASVAVSRAHMLSPAGRCKAFAADADGFVRSEAVAVLVLKPLAAAQRDGDRVLAVLRGSAVNSDGASSGLTAPNGRAQQAVIADALVDAGVTGAEVSYLEAHGTGTALGDPVEVGAAWQVLGPGRRPGEPLHVGSVKSNVGHCESASGMVAVVKTVLALRHERLPANLHCAELNPHVPWTDMNVRVVDSAMPWRATGRPRVAGVSGFGFSGTNAHVVVAEAPIPVAEPAVDRRGGAEPYLLPLSAPDDEGLARHVAAWDDVLATSAESDAPVLAGIAGAGRTHLPVRRAVLGRSLADLRHALAEPPRRGGPTRPPRIAFLFSGQGSQYFGMGRTLYESQPAFRQMFDACDDVLAPQLGASLRDLIWYGEDRELLHQTRVTQPSLVALELSLAALWASWGVEAAAVIGHSVGEITAAIHAGVLDLRDGLILVSHRARLMQNTSPGAMLAVTAPVGDVSDWLTGTTLDIAAVNGPRAVVVAGRPEEVEAFAAARKAAKVAVHRLVVSHAFHSRLMEPMLGELREAIAPLTFRPPSLPIVANVSGRLAGDGEYDADYWCRHVRRPVRFMQGVEQLRELDVDVFLEIGPGRTLAGLVTGAGGAPPGGVLASLRRGVPDRTALFEAVRDLYEQGQDIRWAVAQPPVPGRGGAGPRYPFADTRYWTRVTPATGGAPGGTVGPSVGTASAAEPTGVPHWGRELRSPALADRVFECVRTARFPAYLTDHRLYGTVVTPAASHLATVLSAVARDGRPLTITDLLCPRALVIAEDERYDVQLVIDDGGRRLGVHSLVDADRGRWEEHVAGRLSVEDDPARPAVPDRNAFVARASRHISGSDFYRYFRELGYTLGPSFRWIADVWIAGDEALVRYERPVLPDDPGEYEIYPGLIDSCFQSIAGFLVDDAAQEAPSLAIPFSAGTLRFAGRAPAGPGSMDGEVWGHVRVRAAEPLPRGRSRVEAADLHLFTADGASLMVATDFRVRHAPRDLLRRSLRGATPHLYELTWTPAPAADRQAGTAYTVALRGPDGALADAVAGALQDLGHVVAAHPASGTDLVLDLTHLRSAADEDPDEAPDEAPEGPESAAAARNAVLDLAAALWAARPEVPYAVVCADAPESAPIREALWGMLAAVEAEEPRRRLLRVQVDPAGPDPTRLAGLLVDALDAGVPETRLRLADGRVHVARLAGARPEPVDGGWPGGALITGGLGALGLSVAEILAAHGAQAITLLGRSAPDGAARRAIDRLTARGVRVAVARGDAADPGACAAAVATAAALGPLRAVFHLAGTSADGAFATLTPESFDEVFAGKARGAQALATAVRGHDLAAFVLFSSVSAVLGSAGQANYAAANGYLNGLAMALRARGTPATSVSWGPWEPDGKGGMAATDVVRAAAQRLGVRVLSDAEAVPLLAATLESPTAQLVAAAVDLPRYAASVVGHPRGALMAELVGSPAAPLGGNGPALGTRARGWLREELLRLAPADHDDALRGAIATMVGSALGEAGAVEDDRGFADLGLDSIMVIELRARLEHALALDLPATVALDHPTVQAMASYLGGRSFGGVAVGWGADGDRVTDVDPVADVDDDAVAGELADLSLEDLVRAVRDDLAVEL